MVVRLLFLCCFFSFVYADCYLSIDNTAPKAFALCQNLSNDLGMYWTLPENSPTAEIAFQFKTDKGWVGAGFSQNGQMQNSQVLIGWFHEGAGEVHEYQLGNYELGNLADNMGLVGNATIISNNGRAIILFNRTVVSPKAIPINAAGSNYIVWGLSSVVPSTPTNLQQHDTMDAKKVSMQTGSVSSVADSKDAAKKTHAVLMAFTFILLLPSGVLIARYIKPFRPPLWFKLHQSIQWIGVILSGIAFIIALVILSTKVYMTHRIVGIVTMSLAFWQPFNAAFRPHPPAPGESPTTKRRAWNLVHWWSGRACCILGIVNCYIGLNVIEAGRFWTTFISVVLFVLFLVALSLSFNNFAAERTHTPSDVQPKVREQAKLLTADKYDSDDDK